MRKAQKWAETQCILGENPLWDVNHQHYLWEDIEDGAVYESEKQGTFERIYKGLLVGGFTLQSDGSLLLFREADIIRLEQDGTERPLTSFFDEGSTRFNDVQADPRGRVYAGTIGKDKENGGVFRYDLDGSSKLMFRGTGCSNGMGFTTDQKTFYWTCSTRKKIFAFDYDIDSGDLTNERLFYTCDDEEGTPDGMCVDAENFIWTTRWGGSRVRKISPEGKVVEDISVPTNAVSSCCFGGKNLTDLFITTYGGKKPDQDAGDVYILKDAGKGQEEYRSSLFLD